MHGQVAVTSASIQREWPDWTPPEQMLQRRPDLPRHSRACSKGSRRTRANRAEFPSRPVDGLGWTQQPPSFTPTSMPSMYRKPHCKALLRTMGNVMSRRVKSQ